MAEKKKLEGAYSDDVFAPPKKLVDNSNVKRWMTKHNIQTYDQLLEKSKDYEWYWNLAAKELDWFKPWKKTLKWNPPKAEWFVGGKINITHNAVDRHMKTSVKKKLAYIWEGECGEIRKLTYEDLHREVNRFVNALKSIGVKKGDRVGIYLPMIPELPIAMLACAKMGAIHSVVFSGFSAKALADRMINAGAKVLITCDGSFRRGKMIRIKLNADEALKEAKKVKHVIVVKRTVEDTPMKNGRDIWWDDFVRGKSDIAKTEVMDAEDPLFILYTSGTTGKPKGVVHVHGGYAVGVHRTIDWIFDLKPDDIWWCAADVGWITGHSYIVYGPLIAGATSVMYEGAPAFPEADRWWQIIEKHKVSVLYTSPTAIRFHMRLGTECLKNHEMKTLRLLGSVGEPINPEAWMWYYENIGHKRCQIMDTWWQTETGSIMISPMPITPLKVGCATKPMPGIQAEVRDSEGNSVVGKEGSLFLTVPWPSMLRTIYQDPERYEKQYWSKYPGIYLTGDGARIDKDGYIWLLGREDEVINIAGHRLGTAEVESVLVSHPAVAEAAVCGIPHEVKGEVIRAYVILKDGFTPSEQLRKELVKHVSTEIGPIAKPERIGFVEDLPKTRSGKIMRRVVKAIVLGKATGDTSTLRNPEAVDYVKNAC